MSGDYQPVHPGLIRCEKCAALLLEDEQERALHDRFHDGLRKLWQQASQGSSQGQGRRPR